jgi:hypothetical protein
VPSTKPLSPLIEYCQVAPTSKPLTVITPWQTDAVGNVSDISKNTSPIVIDTTDPIFERQSTVVNANINTPITTTVYDVPSTNNQIIQAITVDITCVGDYATNITRILTVDSKALY